MDVPGHRARRPGNPVGVQVAEHVHVRPGRLQRGHVGIRVVDRADHVTEFGVAQVGVHGGGIGHSGGGQPERADRPDEIGLPVLFAQRQQLAQRGFVDLDDRNAGRLQVQTSTARNGTGHPQGWGSMK